MVATDLVSVDQNLQAIRTLEAGSPLPNLPDPVKLDLASMGMPATAMVSFLGGLFNDVDQNDRQAPLARPPSPDVVAAREYEGPVNTGRWLYGVTGRGSPYVLDNDAVYNWKRAAVDRGYLELTPEEIRDPRWLPEYSSIAREMSFDRLTDQWSGDTPGSMSMSQVWDIVGDWLTPAGLYRAATELDLWWDVDNIESEIGDWGNKWVEWSKQPFNPLKLVDALTGPIDDVIFPVMNWILMATGVGEVYQTGRLLYGGARAVQKANAVSGIYSGLRSVRYASKFATGAEKAWIAGDRVADLERLGKPGLLGTMLRPSPTGRLAGSAVGEGIEAVRASRAATWSANSMEAWRQQKWVKMGKKVNQQAIRLGITSNMQQLLDDRTGVSIASTTGVDEWITSTLDNPMVDWGVDLLFTPTNFFEPKSLKYLGAATGITVAAGPATDAARAALAPAWRKGFRKVTENQKMLVAFHDPMMAWLDEADPQGVRRKAYEDNVKEKGMAKAMALELTGGDVDKLGVAMAHIGAAAVVDGYSRHLAHLGRETLEDMDAATLNRFYLIRGGIANKLRAFDETDPDMVLRQWARYGEDVEDVTQIPQRNARPHIVQRNFNSLQEKYLEPADVAAARGGAVAPEHTRLYGYKTSDDWETLRWTTDLDEARKWSDDPFIADVSHAEYGSVPVGQVDLPDGFHARYIDSLGNRIRLSEAANMRVYDQTALETMRGAVRAHNDKRAALMVNMLNSLSSQSLSTYVYDTLPSFGRWTEYWNSAEELAAAQRRGDLANVGFVTPRSPVSGRQLSMFTRNEKWSDEMFRLLLELPDNADFANRMNKSLWSPFAREVDPSMGRVTVMEASSVTKQEYLGFAAQVRYTLKHLQDLKVLQQKSTFKDLRRAVNKALQSGLKGEGAINKAVKQLAASYALTDRSAEGLGRLVRMAARNGIDFSDIEDLIRAELMRLEQLEDWGTKFRVGSRFADPEDVVKSLGLKLKELNRRANYVASELDVSPALKAHLAERGYKAVYGVEFNLAGDLVDVFPEMADATLASIRNSRLTNFTARRPPEWTRLLRTRVAKSSLWAELQRAKTAGKDIKINFGASVSEEAVDLNRLVDDLHQIMYEKQNVAKELIDQSRDQTFGQRVAARMLNANIPMSIDRLPSDIRYKVLVARIEELGYTADEAHAIWNGLSKSRSLGFAEEGLFAIETHLRSRPNLIEGLRLLSSHEVSGGILSKATYKGGNLAGAGAGAVLGVGQYREDNPDPSFGGILTTAVLGGMLGKAAATAGLTHLDSVGDATGRLGRVADRWEDSKWVKYAYVADNLANLRDRVRFTLSPIFDASRYSEAIIMSQIAELPEGMRNLKLNQSPTAYRRAVARQARKAGKDPKTAMADAWAQWNQRQNGFAAAAKGDFDWETIDSVGRRFSSIGILGFSPAHWMSATFANLVDEGMDARKAYEISRDIHTYGLTGRSPAELSMNFVFFPFSFTKKVAGHMAKFLTDDMSRLVVLHDMMATYQTLSESHDLETMWRERLPILDKMRRLNILAYGISPGRFGGINAPLMEAIRNTPVVGSAAAGWQQLPELAGLDVDFDVDSITNLFIPQMVPMRDRRDEENLWDAFKQTLPAINDVYQLINMAGEQGRVVLSESHLTRQAEVARGWDDWRDWQSAWEGDLARQGLTWAQAIRRPEFKRMVDQKRTELARSYPAWQQAFGDGIQSSAALELEKTARLNDPTTTGDARLIKFEQEYQMARTVLGNWGLSFDNPEEIPGEIYVSLRKMAIKLAYEDSEFLRLYNRFYRRILGDITTELY